MTSKKKAPSPSQVPTSGKSALNSQGNNNSSPINVQGGNTASSQRQRILNHLRTNGSLTTFQARGRLDCMHVGMRICELRKAGHPIETVWVNELSSAGTIHRIANYVLRTKHPAQLSLLDQPGGINK